MNTMTVTVEQPASVTSAQVQAFTQGDCWAFALEVEARYGYPMAFCASHDEGGPESVGASFAQDAGWVHAFNILPSGECFDVMGVCGEFEMLERWLGYFEEWEDGWQGIYVTDTPEEVSAMLENMIRNYAEVNAEEAVQAAMKSSGLI